MLENRRMKESLVYLDIRRSIYLNLIRKRKNYHRTVTFAVSANEHGKFAHDERVLSRRNLRKKKNPEELYPDTALIILFK